MLFFDFVKGSLRLLLHGGKLYYAWLTTLLVLIVIGIVAYLGQIDQGLITTNMRDQVSWGFYIGNLTFLVGVAAAAVVLAIPAYLYHWKPIKEVIVIGELLAVCAIIMCLLFVIADIGRPERFWHLFPWIGRWNVPNSILAWDVLVLNLYFVLNLTIATHILFRAYTGRDYNHKLATVLVLLSIPGAISIHTVTAFVYNGMIARPYWNAAILAPRFLASAFCSGPAIILVALQILRKFTRLEIKMEALWKIGELMAYAMFINLFLLGAELFREYYSATGHLIHTQYLYTGIDGHTALVPWAWLALFCSLTAFFLLLFPKTRRNVITLNLGAALIFVGVFVEKGMALVLPGFTPSTLGDIYEYVPSTTELAVSAGIYGLGFFLFTIMLKVAVPTLLGEFRYRKATQPVNPTPAASNPAGKIGNTDSELPSET